MTITITLNNGGGELDRQSLNVDNEDDSAEVSEQIFDALRAWVLAPGDTITITSNEQARRS